MKITKSQIRKIISEVMEKTDSTNPKWTKWEHEAFGAGLINPDGTSTKLGQLLRRIARQSPGGYDVSREEVKPLIDAGYVIYGLASGGYRAHITDAGRQLLQFF
jgi:hypothetical protein